jgi:acetyl-CoA carboxylase biotin carboxyl carrier protein
MADKKSIVDQTLIRELAELLSETGLSEIEVEHDQTRIRVARTVTIAASAPVAAVAAPAPAAAVAAAAPSDANHPGAVTSPMVGTAYLSPKPGDPQYAKVGDNVTEGQTLLVVEAMKTFNPIPAPKSGKLTQILVANETPVEFGQPLAIIE